MLLNHKKLVLLASLRKAFDKIDHSLLMKKLQNLGFRGKFNTLIATFLSDRKQFVVHGSKELKKLEINVGVPQDQFWARCCFFCL